MDIQKIYEVPAEKAEDTMEIYSDIINILYNPETDRITSSAGGPIGYFGYFNILENLNDPNALYLNMRLDVRTIEINAQNCSEEKYRKLEEYCKDLKEK